MPLFHREIPTATATLEVTRTEITVYALRLRLPVIALTRNVILNSAWADSPDGPQVRAHHDVHCGFGVAT
ncbi:hypothetical protein B1T45_23995 [Mycobacterium kansasii]|uniref:Uncharacterized protein n=3 Tax=Mycobacterium kansasii TaxID=1768 RepID=U5WXT6_MYCKA|nr:hypothetical protein MKAN_05580 [Mycobacterium kansasii ATCC 12478]ARG58296.1 hypothetical protein B1T43_23445 [Mycobacterium kansasii]EUA19825.1 putative DIHYDROLIPOAMIDE S-ACETYLTRANSFERASE E2 COMPONENT PDHC domain protein [Mycobacterium kansasii 662]ARG63810.1 hypothetical protein B1T45_23995 [Mycobacterium kansasii]ARG71455.1 hypothetical protein B1T47_23335 [Mycobacterium kansasii]